MSLVQEGVFELLQTFGIFAVNTDFGSGDLLHADSPEWCFDKF